MKLIDRLREHPLVSEVWAENNGCFEDDKPDWWLHLKKGWILRPEETHTIHEPTLSELRKRLKDVVPCNCEFGGCNESK